MNEEQEEAVLQQKQYISQLDLQIEELNQVIAQMDTLPQKLEHRILLPIVPELAFIPGVIKHTNEVTVLLGDNTYVKRSAFQAIEIARRRIHVLESKKKQEQEELQNMYRKYNLISTKESKPKTPAPFTSAPKSSLKSEQSQSKTITEQKSVTTAKKTTTTTGKLVPIDAPPMTEEEEKALATSKKDEVFEIQEEFDEERENDWLREHREHVSQMIKKQSVNTKSIVDNQNKPFPISQELMDQWLREEEEDRRKEKEEEEKKKQKSEQAKKVEQSNQNSLQTPNFVPSRNKRATLIDDEDLENEINDFLNEEEEEEEITDEDEKFIEKKVRFADEAPKVTKGSTMPDSGFSGVVRERIETPAPKPTQQEESSAPKMSKFKQQMLARKGNQ